MRRLGIDVSEHNGILDWDAIKKGGIEFAIIRSSWGHFEEDKQFRRNVRECERQNHLWTLSLFLCCQ